MTSHRTTLFTLASLAVISAAMPSSAYASPLLSGYGGPGQGNQAILGSALLNGPRNGGGTGGSTGAGSSGASGSATSSSVGSTSTPVSPGHGKQAAGATKQASGKLFGAYSISERDGATSPAVADSGALGLSGADLLYALFALCVLVFTALLTGRLRRSRWREGTSS